MQLSAELCSEFVDQFCDRKSLGNVAGKVAGTGKLPNEQGKDLVRIYERAVAVDRADAIAIAVGAERGIIFPGAHRLPSGFYVRLDRLGMNAGKARIARSANLVAGDAVAGEQLAKQAGRRAVHGVAHEAELRTAEALPIDEFSDRFKIGGARLQRLN